MSPRPPSICVVGASGILGAELVRLLQAHPKAQLSMVCGESSAGQELGELRRSLGDIGLTLQRADAEEIAERCEIAFTALPHGASAELIDRLLARKVRVVDLGSDFRLQAAEDYPRFYGRTHPCPNRLAAARYVLPELTGPAPKDCRLIANPGCFATALSLACAPVAAQLTEGARIAAVGVTGSSGSGLQLSQRVHHSLRHTNLCAYKILEHQHLGEVEQLLRSQTGHAPSIDFVPHSGPFVRGIHLTVTLRRNELRCGDLIEHYEQAYSDKALVSVRSGPVNMGAVVGSCRADIGVIEHRQATVVTVAIDNLLKGGSGQAVQNLNLWLGWPELAGLSEIGIWP